MSYILHISNIKKFILSFQFFFTIISNIQYIKKSKFYSLIKLLFKLLIYFNLFMFTTDFILKYESDEIYNILSHIYNKLINISYNTLNDILNYLKNKFYFADKIEELINDTDNLESENSNIESKSYILNKYDYLLISIFIISNGILIYLYLKSGGSPDTSTVLSSYFNNNNINDNIIPEVISRTSSTNSSITITPHLKLIPSPYNFINHFCLKPETLLDKNLRGLLKINYPTLGTTFAK